MQARSTLAIPLLKSGLGAMKCSDKLKILKSRMPLKDLMEGVKLGRQEGNARQFLTNEKLDPADAKLLRAYFKLVSHFVLTSWLALLRSCIPNPCTPAFCIPTFLAFLHSCILHSCTPAFLLVCISASPHSGTPQPDQLQLDPSIV